MLECTHDIIVAEKLPVDMPVGLDLLSVLGITIDCATRKLHSTTLKDASDEGVEGCCYSVGTATIPPRSSLILQLEQSGKPRGEVVVLTKAREYGALIPDSIHVPYKNRIATVVTNPTKAPILINAHGRVADWGKLDVEMIGEDGSGLNLLIEESGFGEIEVGDHLSQSQRSEIVTLIRKHRAAFSLDGRIGNCTKIQHKIELTDSTPFKFPLRRSAHKEKEFQFRMIF